MRHQDLFLARLTGAIPWPDNTP